MAGSEKYNFGSNGVPIGSSEVLAEKLRSSQRFGDSQLTVSGELGKSGLVIREGERIVGVVRAPALIPKEIDMSTGQVEFGGVQTFEHAEGVMSRELGMGAVAKRAEAIIEVVRREGLLAANRKFGGLLSVGGEAERWFVSSDGRPYELQPLMQEELHSNLGETNVGIAVDLREQAKKYAEDALRVVGVMPEAFSTTTSMYMLGTPWDLRLNYGKLAPYVRALARRMYDKMYYPADPSVKQAWDGLARHLGKRNFEDLKSAVGDLRALTFAASHASLGLDHFSDGRGGMGRYVATETAVAVAYLFNSDLATVAELMTYSTPLVFEHSPRVDVRGESYAVRDARAIMRLAMHTTHASPSVPNVQTFWQTMEHAIVNGVADRVGRSAQIAHVDGREVAAAHGRVRNRVEHASVFESPVDATGRVEFVGGGATPDIVALVSRNAFLQILGLAAYEALAHGQYPEEYYADKFGGMLTTWTAQGELAMLYNTVGPEDSKVQRMLQEAHRLVKHVTQQYSDAEDVQYVGRMAHFGLNRLSRTSQVRHVKDYKEEDGGTIADVILRMHQDGFAPLDICVAIHEYQIEQARRVLSANGDVLALCMPCGRRRI